MFVARKQETFHVRCDQTRNGFGGIISCINCTPLQIIVMGQVRQWNGVKPPETRVLEVKYVVRNQRDVVEHRNGVQNTQNVTFGPKEVHWNLSSSMSRVYSSETFNQMHADTSFRNGSGASIKLRETFKNMSFGPKVVDWAFLLQKKRNGSRGINSCIKSSSILVFASIKECLELLVNFMNKILFHKNFKTIIC